MAIVPAGAALGGPHEPAPSLRGPESVLQLAAWRGAPLSDVVSPPAGMCPRAANPSATSSTDYTVVFTVQSSNSSSEVNGTVGIFFAGQQATLPMPANLDDVTSDYCKLVFESLPNVRTVSCSKSNHSGSSKSFAVAILEWATVFDSYMNNIWYHDGAPTLESWACDT